MQYKLLQLSYFRCKNCIHSKLLNFFSLNSKRQLFNRRL